MAADCDLDRIYKFLSSQFKPTSISILQDKFPEVDGILTLLSSSPEIIWISKHSEEYWEVRAKCSINLCYQYLDGTCGGDCSDLHLCKDYLLSEKACPGKCKFGFSHDIQNKHNKLLLPSNYNKHNKLSILRSSFPRLCNSFTWRGKCSKLFCASLHLCPAYINGTCVRSCRVTRLSQLPKEVFIIMVVIITKKF